MEIGAVGRRAAENLARLRENRHANYTDLSGWLKRLGHVLSAETLGKMEKQERRIDVDDLVALAVALDTTPNRLLLPGSATDDEPVELTPGVSVSALDAWKWATGDEALPADTAPSALVLIRDDRERLFIRENQPHNVPEPYFHNVGHDVREHKELVRMIAAVVVEAKERGVQLGRLTRLVEQVDRWRLFGQLDDAMDRLSQESGS